MANCIIFCAAEFDQLIAPIEKDDYVIAADGGFAHTNRLDLTPDCILGDFDSLGFVPEDSRVFPVEKDDTDAMLAIRRGLDLGYKTFMLYGSLDGPRLDHTIYGSLDGPRLDHTVANFQALQFLADHGARGYLIGKDYIVTAIQNDSVRFDPTAEGILSVFCIGKDANGVTIEGLQYPLVKGTLSAGFPLGVSNHFVGKEASVSVEDGSLLLLYDRKNGLPL